MNWVLIVSFVFVFAFSSYAQDEVDATEALQSLSQVVQNNADLLDSAGIDVAETQKVIADLNQRFRGTYVYDLSGFREQAKELVPMLDRNEETRDYAIWLKSRLDYFEVAEQLRREAASHSKTNVVQLPPPTLQVERKAWTKVIEKRPMPPLAQKHVPVLKQVFTAEKVPPQLVWLAEVESSFNPRARSPVGAAGLFQLMPATAKRYDLSTGFFGIGDDRTDTEKSGHAAARYLKKLHQRFGDWRLALAAYNTGEGRVSELLKKHKAHSFEEIARYLPAETQMYVPKVEATLQKREGVSLSDLKMPKA